MPLALSDDLRLRIIWLHYCRQFGCREIADLLCIHVSTVYRVIDRYSTSGSVSPIPHRTGPMPVLGSLEEYSIIESLMEKPELYLEELQSELYLSTGTWVSVSTMYRAIRRLGYTRFVLVVIAFM